ncbi:hypothetical protein EI94DRAFT_1701914 [Lactarius quietus]|nr:hypothetical protein EI94DRAFT_1701914 [Lactarius quietus]
MPFAVHSGVNRQVQVDYIIHWVSIPPVITNWECTLASGVHIDDAWYEQCIGNEMDSVNEIFDEHGCNNPGTPYPRIHTVIELIGEEWWHKANGQTDEERELDFSNFSRSRCLEWLNTLKVQHPNLKSKIMMMNLPTLMQYQECIEWWKPRTLNFNDEEVDKLSGNNPPPLPDGPSLLRKTNQWMKMRVASTDDQCQGLLQAMPRHWSNKMSPQEKKNVTACLACAMKKHPCSPPPKWAHKIGTESIKAESAPITSKSAHKRTAVTMLEDIIPSLERVEQTVLVDGTEFRDCLSNIEAYLHSMAVTSGVDLLLLNCTPPVPLFNTPSPPASCASTSSINPAHISTLSIQQSAGAGPSGSSTKATETQSSLGQGKATASSSQVPSVAGSRALSRMG